MRNHVTRKLKGSVQNQDNNYWKNKLSLARVSNCEYDTEIHYHQIIINIYTKKIIL